MWFPIGDIKTDNNLIPQKRSNNYSTDLISQEYLEMKALMSYVGDLIIPFNNESHSANIENEAVGGIIAKNSQSEKIKKSDFFVTGGVTSRVAGVVSTERYAEIMKEAVSIWTPLVGMILLRRVCFM
jgi:hypothetical protein